MTKLAVHVSCETPELVEVTKEEAISFVKGWVKDALVACLEENLSLDSSQVVFNIEVTLDE